MNMAMRIAVLSLGLAGCVDVPVTAAAGEGAAGCGAPALQSLVGQPATVLDTMRFTQSVRVIRPGTAVTMDYQPGRLNIRVDAKGLITEVACG